jgi:hypothetical protein
LFEGKLDQLGVHGFPMPVSKCLTRHRATWRLSSFRANGLGSSLPGRFFTQKAEAVSGSGSAVQHSGVDGRSGEQQPHIVRAKGGPTLHAPDAATASPSRRFGVFRRVLPTKVPLAPAARMMLSVGPLDSAEREARKVSTDEFKKVVKTRYGRFAETGLRRSPVDPANLSPVRAMQSIRDSMGRRNSPQFQRLLSTSHGAVAIRPGLRTSSPVMSSSISVVEGA